MVGFIEFLGSSMTKPTMYGWFHILWLFMVFAAILLLCKFFKNPTDKQVNRIVFTAACIVAVLEFYKQFNFTFSVTDGAVNGDYQWYAFPFQFCDIPMYVGLLTGIFRKGKIHDALCAFLGSYAIFAGVAVMLYPSSVFIETIGINIQTMVCHGSMIVIGVYLLYTGYVKRTHKTILKAAPVFGVAVGIAAIANEIVYYTNVLGGETFNLFYISRHFPPQLPVYSLVQEVVPYPICLIIYILVFTFAGYLMVLIAMLVEKIYNTVKGKKTKGNVI